jgi:hypothetical protein
MGKEGTIETCSVVHYWNWWWDRSRYTHPEYWERTWQTSGELSTGIGMMMDWFPKAWRRAFEIHDLAELRGIMRGFDDTLRRMQITTADVIDAVVILQFGNTGGRLGEAALRLWVALWDAETTIESDSPNRELLEAVMTAVEDAGEELFQAFNPDLYPR